MAETEADRCDVDEAQKAFVGLVIAGRDTTGILELVEAPLDQVSQPVERKVDADARLAWLAHWDDRQNDPRVHGFANAVSVIASVGQQGARCWQIIGHDQIEAKIVRCLARRYLRHHGQPHGIDEEMDFGREATS